MKIQKFDVETDVTSIECNIYNASLEISQTRENKLTVEFPHAKHMRIAYSDGEIIIKQGKRFFERLKTPDAIKLGVPSHLIPSLSVNGNKAQVLIEGGIYDQIAYFTKSGSLNIVNASVSGLEACSGEANVTVSDVTVKGNLTVKTDSGDAVFEQTFAARTECRLKNGNIGAVSLNCKEITLESGCGNITASILGAEESYSLSLLAKEGTCNRESRTEESATASVKAYAAKGNIYVDFLSENKEN